MGADELLNWIGIYFVSGVVFFLLYYDAEKIWEFDQFFLKRRWSSDGGWSFLFVLTIIFWPFFLLKAIFARFLK